MAMSFDGSLGCAATHGSTCGTVGSRLTRMVGPTRIRGPRDSGGSCADDGAVPAAARKTRPNQMRFIPHPRRLPSRQRLLLPVDEKCRNVRTLFTRLAAVIVLGAHALEQLDRLGERLRALLWAVRHVDGRLPGTCHGHDVRAVLDEIHDHLVVAARGSVMERRETVRIAHVDIDLQLLDEVLGRGHPAVGNVTMLLGDAGGAVA